MADPTPDDIALRELAQRLLHHAHPEGPTSVELQLRALPDAIGFDLPLPSGAALLGSVVHVRRARPMWMEAVLDAPGDTTDLLATYESDLLGRGWTAFDTFGPMHGGFVSGETGDARSYRTPPQAGAQDAILMAAVMARPGRPSDVRLRLDWEILRHMPTGPRQMPPGGDLLPVLRAPAGIELTGQGASGGSGRWTSEATVATDQPVAALETHFSGQLARAGWARLAGSADDTVAWSSWQLPGEDSWRGLLLVVAPFSHAERSLVLRIERAEPPDDDGHATYVALQQA